MTFHVRFSTNIACLFFLSHGRSSATVNQYCAPIDVYRAQEGELPDPNPSPNNGTDPCPNLALTLTPTLGSNLAPTLGLTLGPTLTLTQKLVSIRILILTL